MPRYHAHCFNGKLAAKNGYGAVLPTASLILGIVSLGCAAWWIDPYETLGAVLCAAGLTLLILSLVLHNRRRKAQLTAFAVGDDGKLYRAKRSGYRGIGLFAAGELTGQLADTLLHTTAGSDWGDLVGGVAGIVAVNRLIKAMGTPSVIETMLSNPDAVCGANLIRIDSIAACKESSGGYSLLCTGENIKTGHGFQNKRIRVAKAYAEPDKLFNALNALM